MLTETVLDVGISDSEESTQKWAATIAFMALQTTNYNLTTAQVCDREGLCVHANHIMWPVTLLEQSTWSRHL